jgi:hypothetical protein
LTYVGQEARLATMSAVKGGMPWSKLRSTIRGFICSELRPRIDVHVTSYRHSHDEAEKAWITIDGNRVLTASWYQHQWHGWPRDHKGRLEREAANFSEGINTDKDEVHLPQDLGDALRAYVDLPIAAALKSANPFIKAFSVVDRRVGKRTLQAMQITEHEHPLVKLFYALRLSTIKSADPRT